MKIKISSATARAHCNICDRRFRKSTQFDRFCKPCKESDDLYRFAGWLPGRLQGV